MKHANNSLLTLKGLLLMILYTIFISCTDSRSQEIKDGDSGEVIHLADPTIFFHKGTYYLYGTGAVNKGFLVYTSRDRKVWEGPKGVKDGFALREEDAFGDRGFWAPQVFSAVTEYLWQKWKMIFPE